MPYREVVNGVGGVLRVDVLFLYFFHEPKMSDDEYTIGQAGFTVKQGSVTLVSASGRYKRKILGNLESQTTTMPSIWRKHVVGQIPTVPTGLRTENKKQLASIGIHR